MAKRVIFTFDDRAYEDLEGVRDKGNFASFASAVRESLSVYRTLQEQAAAGFDEVYVANGKTKKQKTVHVASLRRR